MLEKMIEEAFEGNYSTFSELFKEELSRRINEKLDEAKASIIDHTYNVCEECDPEDEDEEYFDVDEEDETEEVDEAYGKVMSSYGKVMSAYGKDDHTMDPKSHVKKDSDGMFVVYHKNGKAVKKFEDKKEADAYAIKNHDDLMKENMMLAPMGKGRKAVKAMYSKEAYHSKKKKMEAMDKVGQEDGDIDNDGDMDSSDKYLMKRRKAIGKAMKSKSNKSNEGMGAY